MFTATPVSALMLITEMLSGLRPKRFEPESAPNNRMLYLPLVGSIEPLFLKTVEVKLDAVSAVEPIVPATYPLKVPVTNTRTNKTAFTLEPIRCRYIRRRASRVERTMRIA